MKRIGVLASGEGTNLQAIIDAIDEGKVAGKIAVVISDRREAGALKRAEKKGIRNVFFNPLEYKGREDYDSALVAELQWQKADLIVLAGFMRLLSSVIVNAYPGKIMNIHPSLLPAFPGLDGVKQALQYGVKVSGCTVHFVDEGLDTGSVILQEAVPVLKEDTEETLHERIHAAEYRSYPRAIDLFCRGKLIIEGRRCVINEKKE